VGYDMLPSGNSAATLGNIDPCVEVSAGSQFEVDVFLDGLPTGESVAGFGYDIVFADTALEVIGQNADLFLISQPGSSLVNLGEAVPGNALPDNASPHTIAIADLGPEETSEYNPPYTQGVLARYTFRVLPTAAAGVYPLTLTTVVIARSAPPGGELTVDEIRDANFTPQHGLIAVGRSCVGATATPLITPTPTPVASPTPMGSPTPTATTTPTPGTTSLIAGWNHVCYRGPQQAITDALGPISAGILAAYQLRPDQGYDRWFAGRPEISTLTTASPYQPLFILMTGAALWNQGDGGVPPSSAVLSQGWNSVCYAGQTLAPAAATTDIAGEFSVLYLLASDQSWQRFVAGRPEISNLLELQQFAAVLVLATPPEGTAWTFNP
jgi:hypothetical protein